MTNYSETDITVEKVFSRYIQTCLYHSSRDCYRKYEKDSRHIQSLDSHTNHQQFTVDIQLESFEETFILQENVRGAIQSLSQKDQEFVYQKYFLGLSDLEIAFTLGISRQAVTKSKQRILERLKSKM